MVATSEVPAPLDTDSPRLLVDPPPPFDHWLQQLTDGHTLSVAESRQAVQQLLQGSATVAQTAAFLTALRVRGETVSELVGAVEALRQNSTTPFPIPNLLDTCGTGGDQQQTFNISTAVAFVVSACGIPVAKHGNRGVSSRSGSSDVLEQLGISLSQDRETAIASLQEHRLCFLFAPHWHPALQPLGPIRRELRFRTLFNLIGPLANPAGPSFQLIGTGRSEWLMLLAETVRQLGTTQGTLIVHGSDGLDEVTLTGDTDVVVVRDQQLQHLTWTPTDFGLPGQSTTRLRVQSPAESAALLQEVLAGERGPARDYVLANAAACLWLVGKVPELRDGVRQAAAAIDRGLAKQQWLKLSQTT